MAVHDQWHNQEGSASVLDYSTITYNAEVRAREQDHAGGREGRKGWGRVPDMEAEPPEVLYSVWIWKGQQWEVRESR